MITTYRSPLRRAAIFACAALTLSCGASQPAPVLVEIAPAIASPEPATTAPDPAASGDPAPPEAKPAQTAVASVRPEDLPVLLEGLSLSPAANAEVLFRQARQLMAQGSFAEACQKLEESQRIDPGIGTLLNLASCEEKINKRDRACAHYAEAARLAQQNSQQDRAQVAQDRFQRLGCQP